MSPEERTLLERTLKLSEENNKILRKVDRRAKWSAVWGFIKIALIVIPLIAGYIYLQPFLQQALDSYSNARNILNSIQ